MGVTHVIRGADLIAATDVHRLLQALLGLPVPVYRHHALVCGPDGRRLAKRDAAAALGALRDGGIDGHALAADLLAGRLSAGYSLRRSEEHTSELQSLMRISYAVFCLKKK